TRDDVLGARGVEDHPAGVGPRLRQVAVTYPPVEVEAGGFQPVAAGPLGRSLQPQLWLYVQKHGEVGLESAGDLVVQLSYQVEVETATVALVGHAGRREAIGDDVAAGGQRGRYDLADQLRPGGAVEEELGEREY